MHDRFGFLADLASHLKGIALLELWEKQFDRERTGISPFGKLAKNVK
jgi:hypothetical protein